jgi:hypothetical protein
MHPSLSSLLARFDHHAVRTEVVSPVPAPIVTQLANVTPQITSTIPPNGDLNPYGVAFVPAGFPGGGTIQPGDVLVSNFNASSNLQGTGTTIVRITPDGTQSVFFPGQPGLGLTTALGVLQSGYVIVGNLPSTDGTSATAQPGSLLILDRSGNVALTLSGPKIDGPWDLTVRNFGNLFAQVFVSNVLNGTVTRIDLLTPPGTNRIFVLDETTIASGFTHRGDPAAFELGPTGLVFDPRRDVLYVASTADNAIFAIPGASFRFRDTGRGTVVFADPHLRAPLGLVMAPNGDLITANGDAVNGDPAFPGELVEFNPATHQFVGQFSLDPAQGSAFGLALTTAGGRTRFAAVNDDTNSLELWTLGG